MNTQLTLIVKTLLILNIAIFGISFLLFRQFGYDVNAHFGLHSVFSEQFNPIQYITYLFLHSYTNAYGQISFMHVFKNMFALFMFGPMLEQVWGPKRFLTFYLLCGIGAGVLYSLILNYEVYELKQATESYLSHPNPDALVVFVRKFAEFAYEGVLPHINQFSHFPGDAALIEWSKDFVIQVYALGVNGIMVGASGAVFGVLMGFAMLFSNTELMLIFIPIPIKAKYLIGAYAAYETYMGLHKTAGDNVAHFAHIGGMIIAFIVIKIWNNQRNSFY